MTRRRPTVLLSGLVIAGLALAACGDDSDNDTEASGTRTIEIEMRDVEFSPDEVQVEAGETVRFVFENTGAVTHDAFIGDETAQDEHEMAMREAGEAGGMNSGNMNMGEDSEEGAEGITVAPGETGELTYTFQEGEDLLIGCHQPGHYEAGMRVAVDVS